MILHCVYNIIMIYGKDKRLNNELVIQVGHTINKYGVYCVSTLTTGIVLACVTEIVM